MPNEKKPREVEMSLHPSDPPGTGHDSAEPSAPDLFVGGTDRPGVGFFVEGAGGEHGTATRDGKSGWVTITEIAQCALPGSLGGHAPQQAGEGCAECDRLDALDCEQ